MRIVQNTAYLKNLVRAASEGGLVPAAFQRPYVWSRKDVLSLMESLKKGYPVGSFLLWTPFERADLSTVARPRLGPLTPDAGQKIVSVLLDGQNRLATLAWAMRDNALPLPSDMTEHELEVWGQDDVLALDLETAEFSFMQQDELESRLCLPVRALLDNTYALQLVRKLWNGPWRAHDHSRVQEAISRFDRMQDTFLEAQAAVCDMQRASLDEARDAFSHICRVGVPMSERDFDAALKWGQPEA